MPWWVSTKLVGTNFIQLLVKKSVLLLSKHSQCFRITQAFLILDRQSLTCLASKRFFFFLFVLLSEWNQEAVSPISTKICVIMHLLSHKILPLLEWSQPCPSSLECLFASLTCQSHHHPSASSVLQHLLHLHP